MKINRRATLVQMGKAMSANKVVSGSVILPGLLHSGHHVTSPDPTQSNGKHATLSAAKSPTANRKNMPIQQVSQKHTHKHIHTTFN